MEATMATITLKNIPDSIYKTLKQLAADHHRSVNSEIIHLLEKATQSTRIDPDQHLLLARTLRQKTNKYILDEATLGGIKNEGRP
jgi:plasmid stability protein